jgi:hypothetical protein
MTWGSYVPGEDPFAATARCAREDLEFLDMLARELSRREGNADLFETYDGARGFYRQRVLTRLDTLAAAGAN